MRKVNILSPAEQVAAHLLKEMQRGIWERGIPGVIRLEAELGVNRTTVEAALKLLEAKSVLIGQGPGRARLIAPGESNNTARPMRVTLLLLEKSDRRLDYIIDLQHALDAAGHTATFAEKTLTDLHMDATRVARFVNANEANAWVVCAGSQEVLETFAATSLPTFALFGRYSGLQIAACRPDKTPLFTTTTRMLIELGHRRIVLLCREMRRLPVPGQSERAFLNELEAHGIAHSAFNLPHWQESAVGLQELLAKQFERTPPSAFIIEESTLFFATLQFLANCGIRVPGKVSLICTDPDPSFTWSNPSITHMRWDSHPLARRIVRWAANVSRGKKDFRQTTIPAELVMGGTIGPTAQ